MSWEIAFLDFVQANLRAAWLTPVMKFFTTIGDNGYLWIAMILVLLIIPKTRKTGLIVAGALLLEFICCNLLIKPLVGRVRPYEIGNAILLVTKPTDASFPSGHTGSAFACITALFYCKSKLRWPALACGIIIAWTRLYFYLHFPTDILGGVAIGAAAGLAGAVIVKKLITRAEEKKRAKQ